jgi:hypothetical protein
MTKTEPTANKPFERIAIALRGLPAEIQEPAIAELAAARELVEAANKMLPSFNPTYPPVVAYRAALAKVQP